MRSYIIKRLLLIIPTLFGITVITFMVIRLAPGDPAKAKIRLGEGKTETSWVTEDIIRQTRELYGLDKPWHISYIEWVGRIFTLNFGTSFKDQRPVMEKIRERIPITLTLNIISIFLSYLIAVPIGVYSAVKPKSFSDRILTVVLFILYSLPSFWVAMLLILFLGSGQYLDIFPTFGIHSDMYEFMGTWDKIKDYSWHLVLPVICLTYGGLASLSRFGRVGMMEVIRADYIRTARAKGLAEHVVIMKHALRNSLIPIITLFAFLLPAMLGGAVIIETIFSIPGMGKLSLEAILSRDYPLIMGIFTISAFLTLAGLLLSDILYAVVDPRISFEGSEG